MSRLNIDDAMDRLCAQLRALPFDENEKGFRKVENRFKDRSELAVGDYPAAMAGFESIEIGPNDQIGEVLLLCLNRGARTSESLMQIRRAVAELLLNDFNQEDLQVSEIESGDIFPGSTEPAESGALPDGAYIASWLRIEKPVSGLFFRFVITISSE
ncbi:hypothetical protein DRQ36_06535 [bacterium]|nr:MAG: hypothetical protein DRQ36_06535 [bacterium]